MRLRLGAVVALSVVIAVNGNLSLGEQSATTEVDPPQSRPVDTTLDEAKEDWKQAEKLTIPPEEIEPKFVSRNGQDRTYVERITHNMKTKEYAKMLAEAQEELVAALNMTNQPDHDPPVKKLQEHHPHIKKKYEKLVSSKHISDTSEQDINAAIAKVMQTHNMQQLKAKTDAAKSGYLAAQAKEGTAAARVEHQADKEMKSLRHAANKAAAVVTSTKAKYQQVVTAAAKSVESVKQDEKLQHHKGALPMKVHLDPINNVAPNIKRKSSTKQQQTQDAKQKTSTTKKKMHVPVTVRRAVKEVGLKKGFKVSIGTDSSEKKYKEDKSRMQTALAKLSRNAAEEAGKNFDEQRKSEMASKAKEKKREPSY